MLTKNEIKYIQLLQDKKHRDAEGRFVAEGTKWVKELLQWQPAWIDKVYATRQWFEQDGESIAPAKKVEVKDHELEKISGLSTPSRVVAVVHRPATGQLSFLPGKWNLVLDGIQDPGNMGSIIRIADWFGLPAIWCSPDCADAYNPKVVQATMGSLCRVQVLRCDIDELLAEAGPLPVFVSGMEGVSISEVKVHEGVIVIGSEGKGVRASVLEKAGIHRITIPRIGHAESLNAAVATGIMIAGLTAAQERSRGH
ncbi:MAG TPA: RNA methyltransferase [Phnomibacter sp.]|nr:RNA methyltransferase [Phnomibacter sp.]